MADIIGDLENLGGQVTDKGIQLADTLRPTAIDILSGNPHTLAEWLIYIICLPITLPLTFMVAAIRWLLVEAPMIEKEILKLVGVARTSPLGEIASECGLNEIGAVGGLMDALINPATEFDLGIMESVAGEVAGKALDTVLNPTMRPVGYCVERSLTNKFVEPSMAAEANHMGLLDSGTMAMVMATNGYNGEMSDIIWNSTKESPDIGSALTLLNRGYIDEGSAYNWARISGLEDVDAQALINLRWHVPSIGEIQGFIQGLAYNTDIAGQFGLDQEYPNLADADLAKNGASQDVGIKSWRAHWSPTDTGILLDMYHRNIIGIDEVMAGLKFNGTPPAMRNAVIAQGVTLPMRRMINQMMRYGVIDANYATSMFIKYGFSSDDATRLTQLAVQQVNPIEQGDLATDATTAYEDGLITYDSLISLLKSAGHNDYMATLHAGNAEYKKNTAVLKTVESYCHDGFINGDLTLDEAVQYCLQYGEMPERAAQLRLLWNEEQIHTIKHVSEADARSAYTKGLINAAQLRQYLKNLHYASDDIDVIVALVNSTITAPQESLVAPITNASGKAHSFTKAELKKMYLGGIIDGTTWWNSMLSLGYTDAQVNDYAQLIMTATTTATGS
jgi:hypothetical protein